MKFTIATADIESLSRGAGVSRPRKTDTLKLFACAARVFVESKDGVAGIEALVLADGAVSLPAKSFSSVLKTYKGTKFLNFDGSSDGLRINAFTMPVLSYDPTPIPPADFQTFPVSSSPEPDARSRERR
ncbi:MAG: hypothetical protein H0U23_00405 [Blastocatellia bacterium]|nr:hypothetical protein [Blastocatellia bacterium]